MENEIEKAVGRGFEAGYTACRRKISREAYPEIVEYLEHRGVSKPEEIADYICQIIKGYTAEEVME